MNVIISIFFIRPFQKKAEIFAYLNSSKRNKLKNHEILNWPPTWRLQQFNKVCILQIYTYMLLGIASFLCIARIQAKTSCQRLWSIWKGSGEANPVTNCQQEIFLAMINKKPCTSWNNSHYIETQDFLLVLFFDAFFAKSCPSPAVDRKTNFCLFPAWKPATGEQEQRSCSETCRLWSCNWSTRRPAGLVWWVNMHM